MAEIFDGTVFIFNLARHVWAYIIGGLFTFIAIVLSLVEIYKHFMYNQDLRLRTHVLRILLMVPIYATNAYLGLLNKDHMEYFTLVRDAYEAVVIYAFANFLFDYLGGQQRLLLLATLNLTPYPGACHGDNNDMYVTPDGMLTDSNGKLLPQIDVTVNGGNEDSNSNTSTSTNTPSTASASPPVPVPRVVVLRAPTQVTISAPSSAAAIDGDLEQFARSYQQTSQKRSWIPGMGGLFRKDKDKMKIDITSNGTSEEETTKHQSTTETKQPLLQSDDGEISSTISDLNTTIGDINLTVDSLSLSVSNTTSESSLTNNPGNNPSNTVASPSVLTLSYTPLSASVTNLPVTETDKQLYKALREQNKSKDTRKDARAAKKKSTLNNTPQQTANTNEAPVSPSMQPLSPPSEPSASSLASPSITDSTADAIASPLTPPATPLPQVTKKVHKHMFPVNYFYPDPVSPARFVFLAKVGILQYVPVQVVCSALAFMFHAVGIYEVSYNHNYWIGLLFLLISCLKRLF